jgi:hypothetical protein
MDMGIHQARRNDKARCIQKLCPVRLKVFADPPDHIAIYKYIQNIIRFRHRVDDPSVPDQKHPLYLPILKKSSGQNIV